MRTRPWLERCLLSKNLDSLNINILLCSSCKPSSETGTRQDVLFKKTM